MANILRMRLQESMGYSLPNFLSDTVFRTTLLDIFFNKNIDDSLDTYISDVMELMNLVFAELIEESTSLNYPKLATALRENAMGHIMQGKEQAVEVSRALIKAEKVQVFTQNPLYMDYIICTKTAISEEQRQRISEKLQEKMGSEEEVDEDLKAKIQSYLLEDVRPSSRTEVQASFAKKYAQISNESTSKQSVMDLQISLHCYADVLMKRLFDTILMIVQSCLIHEVQSSFILHMQTVFDDSVLEEVFVEEPDSLRERRILESRLERMQAAYKRLRNLH